MSLKEVLKSSWEIKYKKSYHNQESIQTDVNKELYEWDSVLLLISIATKKTDVALAEWSQPAWIYKIWKHSLG